MSEDEWLAEQVRAASRQRINGDHDDRGLFLDSLPLTSRLPSERFGRQRDGLLTEALGDIRACGLEP